MSEAGKLLKGTRNSYEDYLKAIYLISKESKGGWCSNSEISKFLNVKPASVSNMLYKLRENDLIHWKPRKSLRLTKKGRIIAQNIVGSYNALLEFFVCVLKLEDETMVQNLCCSIEHYITPEISTALENLILDICPFK